MYPLVYYLFTILSLSHSFFFPSSATTVIYTLSLTTLFRSLSESAETLISTFPPAGVYLMALSRRFTITCLRRERSPSTYTDRKSTRLNSSHVAISYAVFCLKKKTYRVKIFHITLHVPIVSA